MEKFKYKIMKFQLEESLFIVHFLRDGLRPYVINVRYDPAWLKDYLDNKITEEEFHQKCFSTIEKIAPQAIAYFKQQEVISEVPDYKKKKIAAVIGDLREGEVGGKSVEIASPSFLHPSKAVEV